MLSLAAHHTICVSLGPFELHKKALWSIHQGASQTLTRCPSNKGDEGSLVVGHGTYPLIRTKIAWSDWLTDWLTEWLNEWMNDWLTDWLTETWNLSAQTDEQRMVWLTDWPANRGSATVNERVSWVSMVREIHELWEDEWRSALLWTDVINITS